MAWCYYQRGQLEQQDQLESALAEFSEQVEKFPQGELAADARFRKAECLFKLERYDEALPIYTVLKEQEAPSETVAVLTRLHAGQCAQQLDRHEEAIPLFEEIVADYAESPYVAEAMFEHAQSNLKLEQYDEALELYAQAAEKSRGETGARSRYMMGEIHFLQGEFNAAVKEFQRVVFGYGAEDAPKEIRPWQAEAAYEAGRCFEARIANERNASKRGEYISQAKRYYNIVVSSYPQSDKVKNAQSRLAELAKTE